VLGLLLSGGMRFVSGLFKEPLLLALFAVAIMFSLVAGWGEMNKKKYLHAEQSVKALQQSVDNLKQGIAEVNARAAANKAAVEGNQKAISHDEERSIRGKLADALERLRNTQASLDAAGSGAVPQAAGTPASAAGAGGQAKLDEVACTSAVIKAEGWQDWYAKMRAASGPAGQQPAQQNNLGANVLGGLPSQ